MKKKHIGENFDDFLESENILAESEAVATKRTISFQIEKQMKREKITKFEMAKRMKTSRAALDRLLDPNNISITLQTLEKAALTLGKRVKIKLV